MSIAMLLEGFAAEVHPRDWHGRFRVGDVVRVKGSKRDDGTEIVGRIQRFTEDGRKAIVAPEHGGAHIEATSAQISFHNPLSATRSLTRRSNLDPAKDPTETHRERATDRLAIAQAKDRRAGGRRQVQEATVERPSILGALLEGFDERAHPRGWHGRFVGSGESRMLHVFHGETKVGEVRAGTRDRISVMRDVGTLVGSRGRTISTRDIGSVVDRAKGGGPPRLAAPGRAGPAELARNADYRARQAKQAGKYEVGDQVMYEHGFFGKRPATVTKVTKDRVHIRPQDSSLTATSMTHNQAAVRLRHQNLDEAREFARQRLGIGEFARPAETRPLAPFSNAVRSALPKGERPATAEQGRQLGKVLTDIQTHTQDYTTAQRVVRHHLAKANVTRAEALSSREHSLLLKDLRGLAKHGPSALEGVRGGGIGVLLEAFTAAGPPETPAQSLSIATRQVATAQKQLSSAWNAAKHPRGRGGKFGYTTGGKRARRGKSSSSRTLAVGSKGALVKSVQRQLGVSPDGVYGPQTHAAVARYQQQHHLQVDGVIGRQTIAALRGHVNPQSVAPGPISSKVATVRPHTTTKRVAKVPPAPVRVGGGVVV